MSVTDPGTTELTVTHLVPSGSAFVRTPGSPPVDPRFGEYLLLNEIARGGMGIVYRAQQVGLDRIVALKMILAGKLAGSEEILRFQIEARAAAQLRHPNIVAIYDVGEHQGHHFFSMEFVPGTSLDRRVEDGVLPSRLAAHYVQQAARALHFAHEKGILHRDLKPANILLDENDQVKITDFGLAKVFVGGPDSPADGGGLTRTGAVMGTPSYMAPEQAAGETKELGPAVDVYGLGAILYELLSGHPPFKGESQFETILQVMNQDPVPPRLFNRHVAADLETICLKCLEKDPKLRYPTALALAEDLQRYLDDEPIAARSVNILERLTRTLSHSQHDKELRSWGVGLIIFGWMVFVAHGSSSLLLWAGQPEAFSFWIPRMCEIMLLAAGVWYLQPRSLWPTSAAQRLIWATWVGYLLAYASLSIVLRVMGHPHVEAYAASAALSGLAFFVMGAHVWGWCYVLGLLFMASAPLMAFWSDSPWSPLWFGALWAVSLVTIGRRYWRLGERAD